MAKSKSQIIDKSKDLWKRVRWDTGISPVALYTLVVIIILMSVFVFLSKPTSKYVEQFNTLSKIFSVLSIFILIYITYANSKHNALIQEQAIKQQSFEIQRDLYIHLIDKMSEDFPETYFFLNQLEQFDPRDEKTLEKVIKYDPNKRKMLEHVYANTILELFEAFLSFKSFLLYNHFPWVKTFYYAFKTPILYKTWLERQDTYTVQMKEIIDEFGRISKLQDSGKLTDEEVDQELLKINFDKT